ncbi:MAG: adenylosuccinate synthetase, partial [Candidatus Caldarchaeum sp.]
RPVIASGCLLDPEAFEKELQLLQTSGHRHQPLVSMGAHIVLPMHRELDGRLESLRGSSAVGTTRRGIGPAYADKMLRVGIRVGDLLSRRSLGEKVEFLRRLHGVEPGVDFEKLEKLLRPFAGNVQGFLNEVVESGGRVLLEGAQGTLLDIDHGTYPYVTSSNTISANGFVSTGLPISRKGQIIGVTKAYTTRVGAGPFPTEITGPTAETIREKGGEYGTTTGRPRRIGWLDIPALRYACMVNGVDTVAVTKSDVLSGLPTVKACVRYVVDGVETNCFGDFLHRLDEVQPVYEEFRGWSVDEDGLRRAVEKGWDELPPNLREYLEWLEKQLRVNISIASVGEEASLTVTRR